MFPKIHLPVIVRTLFLMTLVAFAGAPLFAQESVVPAKRIAIMRNMDFPGSDLQPVFETTFQTCKTICLADDDCRAFTFNTSARACFPKSEISERQPFEGAVSATVFETDPKVLDVERAKIEKLGDLPQRFWDMAAQQARNLAGDYVTNHWTEAQLLDAAANARLDGNLANTLYFTAAALNLTDRAETWLDLADLAQAVKPKDGNDRLRLRRLTVSAALNAYLRGNDPFVEAAALGVLAHGVEVLGDGRSSIPVLRVANSIFPTPETETALERAISLFGFRITEHQVDSNAATPRICVTFSEELVTAGVDYASYVRLSEPGLVVENQGRQLCIDGVRHGQRYGFTIRRGLPAESGETLHKSVDLSVYVRDRDPSARFVGRGYVLARGGNASIPIVTVNLDEVDLKIHRVGDRNLVRTIQHGYFLRPLSAWDEKDVRESLGEEVWSGKGIVRHDINQDVTTSLPIGDAIAKFQPGVYVLRARVPGADAYNSSAAAQWFIVTDIGMASMTGGDGLHVFVRSLATARAKSGVNVRLLAKNNNILAEAVSDDKGYVKFPPGLLKGKSGSAPVLLTASGSGDFAFLSLRDAAFDLSDRGVEGRASPPPIDVFLSTDRGAYRTNETVYATALLRDSKAEALENLPLSAVITRPDGVEFSRALLKDQGAGGHVLGVHLPASAQRGTWRIRLYADVDADALAQAKFLVEDIIPDRIEFDASLVGGPIGPDDVPMVELDARYLYGAPGAGLRIEAETRISRAQGLEGFPGYRFGRYDTRFPSRVEYTSGKLTTDQDGHARFGLTMPKTGESLVPLRLDALVRVREGSSRPVERSLETTLAPTATLLGIKPLFDGVVSEGGTARFQAIAVGPDLQQQALGRVGWVLNKVVTRYQWYETYGNWKYEAVTTRTRVASGEVDLTDSAPAQIDAAVQWGRYELKLETLSGEYAASSVAFSAGWYAPAASSNTPDTLAIGLDHDLYKVGDTARLRVVPRYSGIALITVMSNHLIDMKTVEVAQGENLIDLPVTEDWGAGAYVSATVIRPMDTVSGHNPARALGLGWASVAPGDHRLGVAVLTPDEVSPRTKLEALFRVSGVKPGEQAFATIAAVDVGILNLTGFSAPDPNGHYFGQRKLGMDLRDVYGRLIDGSQGTPGQIRSGGDGPVGDRLKGTPPTEELVAFFSGPVTVDQDGFVRAEFDLPEFNGTVRLMAVVWSKTGVGQASKDVLVRDPIVMSASVPRFLAPYDESRMLIELAHASGPVGDVRVSVSASDGLFVDSTGLPDTIHLGDKQRVSFSLPMVAPAAGTPEIAIRLVTPEGKELSKTIILPVRANDPEIARTSRVELADGDTLTLDRDVFAGFLPGTGKATLAVGPVARFDAPGLLAALDRYPYGCSEQITSKALPLLYFGDIANAMGLSGHQKVGERIDQAIAEVLSNQSSSGAFGLWRPGSGDLWLDAYVSDFLSRARGKGFIVPAEPFRLAMDNLRNRVNYAADFENGGEAVAYSLMVLAREGAANIGDLRYYADARADNFATPLALAQLGAALASYGDQARADAMFRKAGERLDQREAKAEQQIWRVDYGTNLRDTAAVLTLAVEAGSQALDSVDLARRIVPAATVDRARSTQENMWSLMAANALIEDTAPDAFLVNGNPANGPLVKVLDAQTGNDRAVEILNNSGKSATTVLTAYGIPAEPEPASGNGYFIERSYFTLDGLPVSLDKVRQNQKLVVFLKVTPERYSEARLIVNDPLPAGLEIDNPNLLKSGDVGALDWLQLNVTPRHVEFRAERFVAAVDWSSKESFQLAYFVRAISPGAFHHPAASVQDMYRPEYRARTDTGRVGVVAD